MMLGKYIILPALSLAVLFEATTTTLPLLLILLLIFSVTTRSLWIFLWAIVFGFLFDLMTVGSFAKTSIFLVFFLTIVMLYERKFEAKTVPFIFFAAFFGSFCFLLFYGYGYAFSEALASSLIAVLLFLPISRLQKKRLEKETPYAHIFKPPLHFF